MIGKHRAADKLVSLCSQDLRHLAKGNQVLLLRLLKALEVNRDGLSEGLRPSLAVVILLDELAKDLQLGPEGMRLLAHQQSVDGCSIQTGPEEHTLTKLREVLDKGLELLLRLTGIVDSELAGDGIKLLEIGEPLEVGRRSRLQSSQDLGVAVRRLQQGLGHVTLNEEDRRQEVRGVLILLLEIANTGTLAG